VPFVEKLTISILIGLGAGLLDITPMILQKMEKRAVISAFLQYFFIAIIIVHINLPWLAWWLTGPVVALALSLPVMIIVSTNDQKSLPIIGTMSLIIGFLSSLAARFWT
jgi:hypothetical protein